jgi:hypothetical protein
METKILHVEAVVKIYFTREYSRFKSILGNRELSQSKIKKLTKDITNGLDMLKYCPIIVDEHMNVIDGQHRLWVAKKLESNVWYVIANKKSLYDIAKINSAVERWKAKDFINCYINLKNENYIKLERFMREYNIGLTVALSLLQTGNALNNSITYSKESFESGNFQIKHLESSIELMRFVEKFNDYKGFNRREFIDALQRIIKANKCDIERLLENFKINHKMMEGAVSTKQIIVKLEEIYNYKKSIRVQIC